MEFAVAVADFVGMWVTRRVIHISIKINIKYISCRYRVYTKIFLSEGAAFFVGSWYTVHTKNRGVPQFYG